MSGEVWERFTRLAAERGHKTAVIDAATGASLSYANLRVQAEVLSEAIEGRQKGAVPVAVAFVGEPHLAALPLLLACAAAGCCFVPLSDRENPDHLAKMLTNLPGPLLVASADGLPSFPIVDIGRPLSELGVVWQICEGAANVAWPLPFLVSHSSGSTGRPKAIAFSQATKLHRTEQSIRLFNVTDRDTVLSASPLHHSLGQRHLFLALLTGATLVKAHPFSPDLWIKAVQSYDASYAIPVATHLKILQADILSDPTILSSFRCIVTSSAPAEPDFKREILDRASFDFWEIYGMTETACVTAVKYTKGEDTAHLGQAVFGSEIRICAEDPKDAGEIEVYSDCLCDGYWGEPDRWVNAHTSDGYFRSGDLGRLDADGNLVFLGRTNESFDSGGVTIFPAEVENVVIELPQVVDCMAFALPDVVFGNLVAVAYVGNDQVSSREIVRYARANLPRHMWPARVIRQPSFPTTTSGKVDRTRLATKLKNRVNGD